MTEIIFIVEDAPEGGYIARAASESIFAGAESIGELHVQVRDAVHCHFDEGVAPVVKLQARVTCSNFAIEGRSVR